MKDRNRFFILRTLCLLLVLLIGNLLFQDYAYSQIIIIEPCPDDDKMLFAIGGVTLISAAVTATGETMTSRSMRGLSFIIGGVFIWALTEPEACYQLSDVLAAGSIGGGAIGLIVSWSGLVGTNPKSIPTWQRSGYKQYSVPRLNIGTYRRGLRFTYRF